MRLRQLRSALHAFCEEAAWQLAADTHEGYEVPFEVIESGRRDAPLYCYRPLTGAFNIGSLAQPARARGMLSA